MYFWIKIDDCVEIKLEMANILLNHYFEMQTLNINYYLILIYLPALIE